VQESSAGILIITIRAKVATSNMNKFLIFASPRTGSTSLVNLMGSLYLRKGGALHTHVGEPFGRYNLTRWYKEVLSLCSLEVQEIYAKELPKDKNSLTRSQIIEILDACYKSSFCVKHLHYHLSYFRNFSLLEYVMTRGYKIISLTRDSQVLKDVSEQLAQQSGVWSREEMRDGVMDQMVYNPIDIERLREKVDWNKRYREDFGEMMSDYDTYEVSYEEIYCRNNQLDEVHKIMDYLEIDRGELCMDQFHKNMNYNDNKQNTSAVYNKIPNIEEVIQFAKEEYDDDISYIIDP
jgi:LPS sulfotransferase NodH